MQSQLEGLYRRVVIRLELWQLVLLLYLAPPTGTCIFSDGKSSKWGLMGGRQPACFQPSTKMGALNTKIHVSQGRVGHD